MAGKIYLFVMGFLVFLAGLVFVWLMQRSYGNAVETRNWPTTEAVVMESKILERVPEFGGPTETSAYVRYRYEWEGDFYEGERISSRGQYWSHRQARGQELVKKYSKGEDVLCYVNDQEPMLAVLEHDTKAAGYSIWFPAIFVVGGLGMMVGVFYKKSGSPR